MTTLTRLTDLELAAYLCSRVCHDVISPVGAIINGLELIDEEKDEQMRGFALDLIRKSASQASGKLQFARLAFGAAGSAGAEIDLADAEAVTRGYMAGGKAELDWSAPRATMAKDKVKLLLNLIMIALQGIPRGGSLSVRVDGEISQPEFTLVATGKNARIPAEAAEILSGNIGERGIDSHGVQPYYAFRISEACGFKANFAIEGEVLKVTAAAA